MEPDSLEPLIVNDASAWRSAANKAKASASRATKFVDGKRRTGELSNGISADRAQERQRGAAGQLFNFIGGQAHDDVAS
jgi:hypothetical protein